MDKRLRPRYYKIKFNDQKNNNINNKKSKKLKNKLVNKKSKIVQRGGFSFFGKKERRSSCAACIKYGDCTKKMTSRQIGHKKFKSKECREYHKVWKNMKNETKVTQRRDDASLIKAIEMYIKKKPTKTLRGLIDERILSRKYPSKTILDYIKFKKKYKNRKVSLKIARFLGY